MLSVVEVQAKIIYHTLIIHSQNHSYYCDQGIFKITNGYRKFIKYKCWKQNINNVGLNISITFNYLKTMQMS